MAKTKTTHLFTFPSRQLGNRFFTNKPLPLTPDLLILAGRNGEITESGADSMADLWASYHSALGLGSKPPKAPTPLTTGHSVSFKVEQRFMFITTEFLNISISRRLYLQMGAKNLVATT